jgi:hypothetical protein
MERGVEVGGEYGHQEGDHFDSIFQIPFHPDGAAATSFAQRSANTRLGPSLNSTTNFSKSGPATMKRPPL